MCTGVQAGSSTYVAGESGEHGHDAVVSDHGKVLLVTGNVWYLPVQVCTGVHRCTGR